MLHPNLEFVDEYQIDSEIQLRGTRGDLLKQRRWQFSIHPESHTERELRNTQRANVSERPRKRERKIHFNSIRTLELLNSTRLLVCQSRAPDCCRSGCGC